MFSERTLRIWIDSICWQDDRCESWIWLVTSAEMLPIELKGTGGFVF
jgi:hypothetical protein